MTQLNNDVYCKLIYRNTPLTRKCPMKHMKRIKERIRKAIPKDSPKTVVLKKYDKASSSPS